MHHIQFLQDLAVVMITAGVATLIFRQLKQPVVLGYILAGVLIGPHTPPFQLVADETTIETLAELGVIFLMFALGMEFNLKKLKKVGPTAIIAAMLEILGLTWAGYQLGQMFGWNEMDSIFLGAILSVSSTTIIIKALEGLGKTKERFAQLIFGVLIIEDILAILIIALLSGFAVTGQISAGDFWNTIVILSSFLGALLVIGLIIVPRLINYVSRFKSNEMLLITVIALCFGVSLLTIKLGYSVALGAFIIGAIISETRQITRIESLMFPIRDLFSAVFFVSIGLIIDPFIIVEYLVPVIVITLLVIVGKVITCSIGSFIAGNDIKTSLKVGMGLSQIGEFSFIIASLGLSLNATSDFIYPIVVAVSAVTTLSTPYLIQASDPLSKKFEKYAPKGLLNVLQTYSERISKMGGEKVSPGRKMLRRVIIQISLNVLLVTAVFIATIFLNVYISAFLAQFLGGFEITKAVLWLIAMLVSLPMLIAIWRKIQAMGMIISELSVSSNGDDEKANATRAVISNIVFIIGTALLVLLVIMLSSALLPNTKLIILVLSLVAITGFFFYRSSVKVYAWAQVSLKETFAQQPDPLTPREKPEMNHPLLKDAKLETFEIEKDTIADGKMLLELKLRAELGVSVIGIERGDATLINPEAETELIAGDKILLIGYPNQLDQARTFLKQKQEKKEGLNLRLKKK